MVDAGSEHDPEGTEDFHDERSRSSGPARRVLMFSPVIVLLLAACVAIGVMLSSREVGVPTDQVTVAVPSAPHLHGSGPEQSVYRVDAAQSSVSYDVDEHLAGTAHAARGTTKGVAADVLIDARDPSRSQLGDVVVNVEQFTSDQELRDRRIRADYLESTRYPLATFHTDKLSGLPATITDGTTYQVRAEGTLMVRNVSHAESVDARISRTAGVLRITGSAEVKLSDFGIGPISLTGFVTVGDVARLGFDLVAVPESQAVASRVAAPVTASKASPGTSASVSFSQTIEPILEKHCASCHSGNAAGAHVVALNTAKDASAVAPGLALAVSSRYMPPWPASDQGVPLQHAPLLSPAEIHDIETWAAAGAPVDVDPSTTLVAPAGAGQPSIRHDVTMPLTEPYQPTPEQPDDYRCFVLEPHITQTTYVTGFEFAPDQTAVVHHAIITKITAPGRAAVDRVDQGSAGPGWSCSIGAPLSDNTTGPPPAPAADTPPAAAPRSEAVTTWAPGQSPTVYPAGSGVRLDPGDFFSIQVHYHVEHASPPDRSTFFIQTAPGPLDEVVSDTYLGPAEIPCDTTATSPDCDRDTVIRQLAQKFGVGTALIPDGLLSMCNQKVGDFAGMTTGTARSSCTHTVTHTGPVIWMMGHEHQIGSSVRLTMNAGRPDQKVLLDIPQWQFNWQLVYQPAQPVTLNPGDTITIDCAWDRSLLADPHPRYITWAEGSGDEMCYSVIATRQPSPP